MAASPVDFGFEDESDSDAEYEDEIPIPLRSKRTGDRCGYRGHIYTSPSRLVDGTTYSWRCLYKISNCNGRLHTTGRDGAVIRTVGEHNHLGDPVRVESERLKDVIKERADQSAENPAQILVHALQGVSHVVQAQAPSKEAIRQLVNRKRKSTLDAPLNPTDRASIVIPEKYAYYTSGDIREKFLLIDSGVNDENRILIFRRESISNDLPTETKLYVGGTFSVCPPLFAQVFVIVGRRGNLLQPIFHVLLPDRRSVTYVRALSMIKEKYPELNPEAVSLDSELALISAVLQVYPDARINGCIFHLFQAIMRHLTNGLKQLYESDPEINLQVRSICACAYVPQDKLVQYAKELRSSLHARLRPLMDYFQATYIGTLEKVRKRGGGFTDRFKHPRFKPALWNMHRRLENGDDSTNNYVERAHCRAKALINAHHPTIWKFLFALHGLQQTIDFDHNQHLAGVNARKKPDKYAQRDARIRNIMEELDTRIPLEYLRGIAANLSLE
ncbi:hypothetical protein AAVH_38473 [Aphelenchoides avenae]|nr:hypothetical protein AAVH_38473 [Aphelenchus avenae]